MADARLGSVVGGYCGEEDGHGGSGRTGGGQDRLGVLAPARRAMMPVAKAMFRAPDRAVTELLEALREAGAKEQFAALAGRAAVHAPLDSQHDAILLLLISILVQYLNANDAGLGFYDLATRKHLLRARPSRDEKLTFWVQHVNVVCAYVW